MDLKEWKERRNSICHILGEGLGSGKLQIVFLWLLPQGNEAGQVNDGVPWVLSLMGDLDPEGPAYGTHRQRDQDIENEQHCQG